MIDRPVQKITSKYGYRNLNGKTVLHSGVDLRSINFETWKKQRVILPEDCRVLRIGHQEKWGWNVVCETLIDGYTLFFIHLSEPLKDITPGHVYSAGTHIGFTTVTEHMKEKGYGEHLHFGVQQNGHYIDPVKYFEKRGFAYA